jgi:tRNA pseudouridine55 synthase
MFGLLNIDKPAGVTSRDVVNRVARLVKPHKVGHAGTLDPLATGVLVLCVGRATRLVPYIQEQPKTYRAVFRFGCTSDTDDVAGDVIELSRAGEVTLDMLQAALPRFIGRIEQVPPRFSAVKIKGRRAYDLARRGKQPDLSPRTVEVHGIEVIKFTYPSLTLEIDCGSGTYVRAIGRDLGQAVGSGAIMTQLRRLRIGVFRVEDALDGNGLNRESVERALLPAALALAGRPCCTVTEPELSLLKHGRDVPCGKAEFQSAQADSPVGPREPVENLLVSVVDENGRLVAVADKVRERLVPRQVFV